MRDPRARARLVVEGDARVELYVRQARERGLVPGVRVSLALRTPPVRKSTSESGVLSAMTRPCWLNRSMRDHRRAVVLMSATI